MIRPISDAEAADARLIEQVREIFSERGLLSTGKDFEFRAPQQQMAVAVARALASSRHLAVEAGTGVGKSFAYLVPAVLVGLSRKRRVLVSTHTINLQEQLIEKDIPYLQTLLGQTHPFQAVLIKGRANYLCPRRLQRALRESAHLFTGPEQRELLRIAQWARRTSDGSLSDLDPQPDRNVWSEVCSERGLCSPKLCETDHAKCFYQQARRALLSADVLVANHHLFFTELALREAMEADEEERGVLLQVFEYVVLDEAHTLEAVASEHIGLSVSAGSLRWLLHRLWNPKSEKGLLAKLRRGDLVRRVAETLDASEKFFAAVDATMKESTQRVRRPDFVPDTLSAPLTGLIEAVSELCVETEDR